MFNGSSVIDTEMLHITIENSEFVSNGSISGPGVDHIYFQEEYDDVLYNIKLESNVFKDNSSHTGRNVVEILNHHDQITDEQLDGD